MMKTPESLPLHLMLAMMQSPAWSGVSTPWSASLPSYMEALFPWLPKPKSPLEQASDAAINLWQQTSEQWLNAVSPQPKKPQASEQENASPVGFAEFFDPEFLTELGTQAYNKSTGFFQGMQAFLASDYTRPEKTYNILWERGSAQLLDLAPKKKDAVAVLCIPSLINKSTILDLYPDASFTEYLKAQGHRPLILDWGTPGEAEVDFTTAEYISAYALDALQSLREQHDGPIVLLGYCMGGIFATAMAQLAPMFVDGLILFATPWDFSAEDTPRVLLDPSTQMLLSQWIATQNPVAPMVTQSIFHMIDPFHVQEKYSRYPSLTAAEKKHFLAVEEWVNDGVPLTAGVAQECFVDWPQGNILAEHQWKIGRKWIEPESLKTPTLAVIPTRDRIVPVGCALPLAKKLPRCTIIKPDTGHVAMVVGSRAKTLVWEPVNQWINDKF